MPTSGFCSACCSGFRHWHFPHNLRLALQTFNHAAVGCGDLRLAVISPFVDRRHGTERALAELLERLAYTYGCDIHLYAQRVEDLTLSKCDVSADGKSGSICWHKVPSLPGP